MGGVGKGNGSNPRVNFGREALAKVGDKAVVDARGHGWRASFDVHVAENFRNLVGFVMKEAGITLLGEFLFYYQDQRMQRWRCYWVVNWLWQA
jgi:hypothetical protein